MNAVFFDMDGTLIDSRADLGATVNFTRAALGLAPIPLEEAISYVGNGARFLLEHAIPEWAGRFDEIWPMYVEQYRAHMLDRTTLYPGVRATLAELHDRGWLMGINPLDQPAVELGKRLANTRLGASGYPREAADLAEFLAVAQEPESF